MVNSGGVFFGFSLHHLFMHMNHIWPPFGSALFEVPQGVILGFSSTLVTPEGVGGRREGLWTVHWRKRTHRNCTMRC